MFFFLCFSRNYGLMFLMINNFFIRPKSEKYWFKTIYRTCLSLYIIGCLFNFSSIIDISCILFLFLFLCWNFFVNLFFKFLKIFWMNSLIFLILKLKHYKILNSLNFFVGVSFLLIKNFQNIINHFISI